MIQEYRLERDDVIFHCRWSPRMLRPPRPTPPFTRRTSRPRALVSALSIQLAHVVTSWGHVRNYHKTPPLESN